MVYGHLRDTEVMKRNQRWDKAVHAFEGGENLDTFPAERAGGASYVTDGSPRERVAETVSYPGRDFADEAIAAFLPVAVYHVGVSGHDTLYQRWNIRRIVLSVGV